MKRFQSPKRTNVKGYAPKTVNPASRNLKAWKFAYLRINSSLKNSSFENVQFQTRIFQKREHPDSHAYIRKSCKTNGKKNQEARVSRFPVTLCEVQSSWAEVSSAELVFPGVFHGREKKPWQPAVVVLSPKLNERGSSLSHPAAFIRFAMRQPR